MPRIDKERREIAKNGKKRAKNDKILKEYIKKCYNQTKIIMFDYDMDKTGII